MKSVGKKKWASADAKHKAEQLDKDWSAIMQKWAPKPVKVVPTKISLSPKMGTSRLAQTEKPPSLVTPGGSCGKKEPTVYTGSKILGIATMHKSNSVPVFSSDEAIEISKMRR